MAAQVKNMKELELAIAALEDTREMEWLEIRATAEALSDSVKPKNLIRQVIDDTVGEKDGFKLLQHGASIVSGWLINKITVGNKSNPLIRLLGRVGQLAGSTFVNRIMRRFRKS